MIIKNKVLSTVIIAMMLSNLSVCAIENTQEKTFFNFFKKNKEEVVLKKSKKTKRVEVKEIELPAISTFKKANQNFITMSIEECINYAIAHNPNLAIAEQHVKAAESGIGQQKASFAPRLTARVNYNHLANSGSRIANTHTDSIGFNAGISQLIWDFGKTTARINTQM